MILNKKVQIWLYKNSNITNSKNKITIILHFYIFLPVNGYRITQTLNFILEMQLLIHYSKVFCSRTMAISFFN